MTEPGSCVERHGRACEVFGRFVHGVEPARVFASMERRWGALGTFAFDAVGDLWARPQLSRRDRAVDGMRAVRAAFAKIGARAAERGPR